jgi:hypothetical protein
MHVAYRVGDFWNENLYRLPDFTKQTILVGTCICIFHQNAVRFVDENVSKIILSLPRSKACLHWHVQHFLCIVSVHNSAPIQFNSKNRDRSSETTGNKRCNS